MCTYVYLSIYLYMISLSLSHSLSHIYTHIYTSYLSIYLSLYDKSLTLPFCRFLIFFSVASTFVALLFLMLNLEAFEILAHNVDYE